MKNIRLMIVLALTVVLTGCVRNELDSSAEALAQKMSVTLSADVPPVSKVTFDGDGGQLVWEQTDSISLIIGNESSRKGDEDRTANNSISARLMAVEPGVFDGLVDMGTFGIYGVRGAVYPYNPNHHFRRNNDGDGTTYQIGMQVGGRNDADGNYVQTQKRAGVLDGANITLFTPLELTDVVATGDDIFLDGKELRWASSLVCFNIFGKALGMEPNDVLKSIVLKGKTEKLAGYCYYIVDHALKEGVTASRAGNIAFGAGISAAQTITVNLEEGVTLADKTRETGVKVFMALNPKGEVVFPEGAQLLINTDRNSYVMDIQGKTLNLTPGHVNRVAVDMSENFPAPYVPSATKYSTDGQTWQDAIPQTFSKLYVSGGSTLDTLKSIKAAMDRQNGPVSLDFSAADFESRTFPAVFNGTKDAHDAKLQSIRFPSNVNRVADNAFQYCEALSDVDLSKIVGYGDNAFEFTAIRTLRLDKTVTAVGARAFANCFNLNEVYFNSTDPKLADRNTATRVDYYLFAFDQAYKDNHTTGLVVTVGPDTCIPRHAFDYNANLTKLVFEYAGVDHKQYANYAVKDVGYLKEIVVKSTQGLVYWTDLANLGSSVSGNKLIIVPVGTLDMFNALLVDATDNVAKCYSALVTTYGYAFYEDGTQPEDPKPQIEYSDNGSSWTSEIPSSFTSLYVRTGADYALSGGDLAALKTAIAAQSAPVSLDLSASVFNSEVFPATFQATADAPNTTLGSIRFPSNVTSIADGAFHYNAALESVDLTGMMHIGTSAFEWTGLKEIDVPSSVTSMGNQAFAYLKNVTSVYWNATIPQYNNNNNSAEGIYNTGYKYLCNRDKNFANTDWNNDSNPLTVTIGPDVKALPPYFFDTNCRLTNLVIETSDLILHSQWAIRAANLRRIEFKNGAPATTHLDLGSDFAKYLGANEGRVVCPDGKYAEFETNGYVDLLVKTGKFVLREKSKENDEVETPAGLRYSVDGSQWSNSMPETFSSLHVMTSDEYTLTSADLMAVAEAVQKQASPVDLDLSAAKYASTIFPNVFGGTVVANSDSPVTTPGSSRIRSITFPSNVTEIAEYAFAACQELREVSFTGIVKINKWAFAASGLETVDIPSDVTHVGTYSFSYLPDVTEVYFNPTISATCGGRIFPNRWKDYTGSEWNNADKPLTITIGPDCTYVESSMFDTNARLTTLVIEGDNVKLDSQWAIRAFNLSRIVFKGTPPSSESKTDVGEGFRAFENVTGGVIVVPDDLYDAFLADETCVKTILGLTDSDGAKRFTLVKESEDTK